jgi:protein phosphatase 1L
MLLILFQVLVFLFVMTKASALLNQHLFKFKVRKSLKKSPVVAGAARRYGLVEVQGPWDMEDRALVVPRVVKMSPASTLYGVFDGHHGSSASQFCVDHLGHFVTTNLAKVGSSIPKSVSDGLIKAFRDMDVDYCSKEEHISGSTACVVLVDNNTITVANTGDSRAILVSEPEPNDIRAVALSIDHKPDRLDERERIAKAGGTVSHWGVWRVEGVLAMSRAIGDKSLKKYVIPDPDIMTREIKNGDKFVVVGTDGVWDVLQNHQVAEVLAGISDPEEAAMRLMQEIVNRGIVDNTTVIVVDVKS